MDDLPSLNFPPPWRGTQNSPRGRINIGNNHVHYSPLDVGDMDEVPLMSDGEEDSDEEETTIWESKKWQRRLKSRSTLYTLIFDGGWQLMLKK